MASSPLDLKASHTQMHKHTHAHAHARTCTGTQAQAHAHAHARVHSSSLPRLAVPAALLHETPDEDYRWVHLVEVPLLNTT